MKTMKTMRASSEPITAAEVAAVKQAARASVYWNRDLAPVPRSARTWGGKDVMALWVALAACVPTYILASSLISGGMNWWQAVLTVFLGNAIVLIPMVLNAHAGTQYGIPFPVLCRAAFGLRGANIPALLRALVACGWFGIQCWIGGWAMYQILLRYIPAWENLAVVAWLGINAAQLGCFAVFWLATQLIIWRGMETARRLFNIKMPLLIGLAVLLLIWAYRAADGFGPILSQPSTFADNRQFWAFFFPALTANVGFWATLALNIPDFTRYVRTQRAQILGQAVGLPFSMGLYALLGVVVTSATVLIFGAPLWDPVELLAKFENPAVQLFGLFAILIATLATNLAANVVGPANDFANLLPRRISFAQGALITGVIGILIQPWRLVADPSGYIFTWLIAYSALLGAVGGVLICDYWVERQRRLVVRDLYCKDGAYWYRNGFHPRGIIALLAGIAPCVPGFLATIGIAEVPAVWTNLYHYAWFISFAVAFAVYYAAGIYATRRASKNG